ncbi:MAG: hypothetical protein OXI80_17980 [Caldilineaceae bacterium]|nr:hypothetical protein [Caldilineaceae bacterium]
MNKKAVALAADSAVTFTGEAGQKIFPSANKIFTLSKYQPVGVMIYGNADFMGIPWETIIKIYRKRLGAAAFKSVTGYAENFLDFLRQNDFPFSDSDIDQLAYVDASIQWCFGRMKEKHSEQVATALVREGRIDQEFSEKLASQIILREVFKWEDAETAPTAPANFVTTFTDSFGYVIDKAIKEIFEGIPLTDAATEQLWKIAVHLFQNFPRHVHIPASSGVVFAGFGTDEVFPVLESYTIEGRILDYLKHRKEEKWCARIGGKKDAVVLPFAQREMVDTFMAGIDPDFRLLIRNQIESLRNSLQETKLEEIVDWHWDPENEYDDPDFITDLERSLEEYWTDIREALHGLLESRFNQFQQSISKHSREWHAGPILRVVGGLPKDELALMAETLINLTSFKKRVSFQAETVGGPIDVAVISKGDGFIWIKRKNYFNSDANPQFLANYFK